MSAAIKKLKTTPVPIKITLMSDSVQAGFASPATDQAEKELSLDDYLIDHPLQTFFVRAQGESMRGAGIFSGDVLVVDRLRQPKSGQIVIAVINNELTVKTLHLNDDGSQLELRPENPQFPTLTFQSGDEVLIWGVVIGVVRKLS